jgi:hypothetical protein
MTHPARLLSTFVLYFPTRQFAKIKPAVFGSSQDRGVVATFDIGSNECICSVPAKAALRTYPGCSPALGVPADVWQQLPWYAQVCSRQEVRPGWQLLVSLAAWLLEHTVSPSSS